MLRCRTSVARRTRRRRPVLDRGVATGASARLEVLPARLGRAAAPAQRLGGVAARGLGDQWYARVEVATCRPGGRRAAASEWATLSGSHMTGGTGRNIFLVSCAWRLFLRRQDCAMHSTLPLWAGVVSVLRSRPVAGKGHMPRPQVPLSATGSGGFCLSPTVSVAVGAPDPHRTEIGPRRGHAWSKHFGRLWAQGRPKVGRALPKRWSKRAPSLAPALRDGQALARRTTRASRLR